jgi:hypothetical protein
MKDNPDLLFGRILSAGRAADEIADEVHSHHNYAWDEEHGGNA